MTEEQAAAHQRLLVILPSHVHGDPKMKQDWAIRRAAKRQRPVIIFEKKYSGLRRAADALGVSSAAVGYWLKKRKKGCRYA